MTRERLSFHVRVTSPPWGGVFTCTGDTVRAHVPIEVLAVLLAPRLTTIASIGKCFVISGSSNQDSSRLRKASLSSCVTIHADKPSISASVSMDSEGGGWVHAHGRQDVGGPVGRKILSNSGPSSGYPRHIWSAGPPDTCFRSGVACDPTPAKRRRLHCSRP